MLLVRDTLHFGKTAESRMLDDVVGPEIGRGQWRFSCLFQCREAECSEIVACIGKMSWAPDPRLEHDEPRKKWMLGMGPVPDLDEQQRRAQAELAHRFQPLIFLPEVGGRAQDSTAHEPRVAENFAWMDVGRVRHKFKTGRQRAAIRVLYQAWIDGGRRDGSAISDEEICKKVEASTERYRIDRVFENHSILHTVIRTCGKGYWALYFAPLGTEPASDADAA